jgi:hydrogenase maturation protease
VKVLILAYGNTLRGDDGAGPVAAALLRAAGLPDGVAVLTLQQLAPELAESISSADRVIFVDAARGSDPGEICCSSLAADAGPESFTHDFAPAALLALARQLYGRVPEAYALTLCGDSFDLSDQLSAAVAAAMPRFVETIRELALRSALSRV